MTPDQLQRALELDLTVDETIQMIESEKMPTMNDLGEAIGALPKEKKERRTVRVDLSTFGVYPDKDGGNYRKIGTVIQYTENQGARTPSGGKYVARRLTVRLAEDDRKWVGQISNANYAKSGRRKAVTLRPLNGDG